MGRPIPSESNPNLKPVVIPQFETERYVPPEPPVPDRFTTLQEAVRALYYAAHWHADRPVAVRALWEAVRDAAGFEPGQTATLVGEDRGNCCR